MPIKCQISPRILLSIATLYTDAYRSFLEFIDNSLDSAEAYYNRATDRYTKPIRIIFALSGSSYKNGKITIYDNCSGITNLPKVVNSIGDSDKKAQAWTNGQFGYGIYSFLACCNKLEITTKLERDAAYYIPIERSQFKVKRQDDVEFPDPKIRPAITSRKDDRILFTPTEIPGRKYDISGTKIILSDFDKGSWKDIDIDELKSEIEKHFELILSRKNLSIELVRGTKRYICNPFDYDQYDGEIYEDQFTKLLIKRYSTKHTFTPDPPIRIFIKVTKGQEINKRPVFISKGRRISEIKDVKSFRSKNKARLWDHPNVTGFIDLGIFLGPTISRTDFRNTVRSKAFFNQLIELEPLILDVVKDVNRASQERHYRELEDRLNQALSRLARLDRMSYRTDYLVGGTVNLAIGSNGRHPEEGNGGDFAVPTGTVTTVTRPSGTETGPGIGASDGSGDLPGPPNGGPSPISKEPENPFEDTETQGRERRRSGFNVRLVDRDPDINEATNKPDRSRILGGEIEIFRRHPDFEARVDVSRRGKQKITQRLITYLAGEITVHYKDKFHNKMGQPQYNKSMFVDLMDFVYKFEEMLADIAGRNLSDLSD